MHPTLVRLPLLALLLATAAAPPAHDPTVVVGRVTDAATGRPLAGASVRALTMHASTSATGEYRLALPAGRFRAGDSITVTVARVGYETATRRVTLADGETTVDVALAASVLELQAVTVTAAGAPGEAHTIRIRGVSGAAVQRAVGTAAVPDVSGERYAFVEENRFRSPRAAPLSTFAVDVDAASYANVRRFLRDGMLPPVDAVRIEELINYFDYDYPDPAAGDAPFAVISEVGPAPWNPRHRLVHVGLQARRMDTRELPAANLVFLVDVSGSMATPDKLPLVRRSLRLLVEQLRPQDRVAMVVYAGAAGLVLEPTPGDRKAEILEAIDRLEAGGSTAGGAGLRLAYDVAARHHVPGGNNRVILATDGDFNVGASSDAEMFRLIEARRAQGTFLTVLGVGTGNLQDAKMEGIANRGNGNYAYLDGIEEAHRVLVREMGGTLFTVAKDVKLQVEFNPEKVRAYRLIGYENRLLEADAFDDDARDAGEIGAGHSVTALYEIVPAGVPLDVPLPTTAPLRYQPPADAPPAARGEELAWLRVRWKAPDGDTSRLMEHAIVAPEPGVAPSDAFAWSAAVAEFGMLLRGSEHRGAASAEGVLARARAARRDDEGGFRAEFVSLVERFAALRRTAPADGGAR